MPTNKHAIIRYQALDKCFRNTGRKYFIDDLVEACSQAIYEYDGIQEGVKKRQVQNDIIFMESENGYKAEIERHKAGKKVYYRYADPKFTINKPELNEEEVKQLQSVLSTLKNFKGTPQFDWMEEISARFEDLLKLDKQQKAVIEFERNEYLSGLEHLSELYNAITNKESIKVNYQSFKSKDVITFELSPYYLKEYNNRWFLFGKSPDYPTLTNLALDRIVDIKASETAYQETNIDFEEYFEDIIGVSLVENQVIEKVQLSFEDATLPYILSKPLHGSQKVKEIDGATIVELALIPNYELESVLLSFGEKVEVIKPESLKLKLKQRIQQANEKYAD